jgi:hypothetical protein
MSFKKCAFFGSVDTTGSGKSPNPIEKCIFSSNTTTSGAQLVSHASDFAYPIMWFRHPDMVNPHWGNWPGTASQLLSHPFWFQENGGDQQGDLWVAPGFTPDAPYQCIAEYGIVAPPRLGRSGSPGPMYANTHATSNADLVYRHFTHYLGDFGAAIFSGESPGEYPGQVSKFENSIGYSTNGVAGSLFTRVDPSAPVPTQNWLQAADAKTNVRWGLAAGARGNAYGAPGTGTIGATDIEANPMLVDDTRCPLTFAQTIDPGITTNDEAVALFMTMNDDDADPALAELVDNMIAFFEEGFRPTNEAIRGFGYDGSDPGAVPMTPGGGGTTTGAVALQYYKRHNSRR